MVCIEKAFQFPKTHLRAAFFEFICTRLEVVTSPAPELVPSPCASSTVLVEARIPLRTRRSAASPHAAPGIHRGVSALFPSAFQHVFSMPGAAGEVVSVAARGALEQRASPACFVDKAAWVAGGTVLGEFTPPAF